MVVDTEANRSAPTGAEGRTTGRSHTVRDTEIHDGRAGRAGARLPCSINRVTVRSTPAGAPSQPSERAPAGCGGPLAGRAQP